MLLLLAAFRNQKKGAHKSLFIDHFCIRNIVGIGGSLLLFGHLAPLLATQLLVELSRGDAHHWREPEQAYAAGEDREQNPTDEAEVELEELPLVAAHHDAALVDATVGHPLGMVEGDEEAHAIGVEPHDSGHHEQQRPEKDVAVVEEGEDDGTAQILEAFEERVEDIDIAVSGIEEEHLLVAVTDWPHDDHGINDTHKRIESPQAQEEGEGERVDAHGRFKHTTNEVEHDNEERRHGERAPMLEGLPNRFAAYLFVGFHLKLLL